jgi:hypothetical protein
MLAAAGSRAATTLLSNSIFLITFGSNDLFVFTAAKKQQQQSDAATVAAAALVADLIAYYSAAIRGAVRDGCQEVHHHQLGCVPVVRALDAAGGGACADGLNQLVAGFNDALWSLLVADLAPCCRALSTPSPTTSASIRTPSTTRRHRGTPTSPSRAAVAGGC